MVADSKATFLHYLHLAIGLLCIKINYKKSHLVPSERVQFIGAILDTVVSQAFLPTNRVQTVCELIAN